MGSELGIAAWESQPKKRVDTKAGVLMLKKGGVHNTILQNPRSSQPPLKIKLFLHVCQTTIGMVFSSIYGCLKHDYYNVIAEEVMSGGSYEPLPPRPKRSCVSTANVINALSSGKEEKEKMEYTQVLKLRGLPYAATVSDIVEFLRSMELKKKSAYRDEIRWEGNMGGFC